MADLETAWKIFTWTWANKGEIASKLKDIYSWFRGGSTGAGPKPGILILGPGGSGKTTLGKLLSNEYDLLLDSPGRYEESLGIERYTLKDDVRIEIVVPPGQEHRREATWADLHADLAAGKFRGVVLLTAYGYHTLGEISYKDHKLYEGGKDRFLADFLQDRRGDELAVLRQLLPHVKVCRGKLWILTLVAKQDLWWSKRADVEKHYREGEYGIEIDNLLAQQDRRQLRHELVFASLVISNFTTGRNERLKLNTEGYDHHRQVESLRRLFETVGALKNWEAES